MNILKIIRPLALCSLVSVGIIQSEENAPKKPDSSSRTISFVDDSFQSSYQCIQQLDEITGILATLIHNNRVHGLSNKDVVMRAIFEDRQLLMGLLQIANEKLDAAAKAHCIDLFLNICDEFITHIDANIYANFKSVKGFDISSIVKKRSKKSNNRTPNEITAAITALQKRLAALREKAHTVGLTWYNKAARSLDKHFVSRWNKYHMTDVTKYGLLTSAFATYLTLHFGKDTTLFDKHQTEWLKVDGKPSTIYKYLVSIFGEIGHVQTADGKLKKLSLNDKNETRYDMQQQQQQSSGYARLNNDEEQLKEMSVPGLLDFTLSQILSNHAPIAMLAGTYMIKSYTDLWSGTVSPWIETKQINAWNFLRGGSYLDVEASTGFLSFEPSSDFDDMVGLDEVKEEFSTIIKYIENPELFNLAKIAPETGWILTGPTRTGKTFSFECLCGEITKMQKAKGESSYKFIKVEIDDLNEAGIKRVLEYAKYNAPMIIFIDEIDLLGLNRASNSERLMSFLTAIKGTEDSKKDPSKIVILITATNSPETLDKALRQNGRLGKEIRFEYPTAKFRKEFLVKEFLRMALDPRNFDINAIVEKTYERSYEDLQAIIRTSTARAWALGVPLSQKLIEDSIRRAINKIIMIDRKDLPENEINTLATHFAGKALALSFLDTHAKLDVVTIKAVMTELYEQSAWHVMHDQMNKTVQDKIVHGGAFTKVTHDTINLKTREQLLNEVKVLIAGFVAEDILLDGCSMQCHIEDHNKAYDILDKLVFEGIYPSHLSKAMRDELRDKTYALLAQCKAEVRTLLENHRDSLEAIVSELKKSKILSDDQVKAIIDKVEKQSSEPSSYSVETT